MNWKKSGLKVAQCLDDIAFQAIFYIGIILLYERFSGNPFEKFNVAVADFFQPRIWHGRYFLTFFRRTCFSSERRGGCCCRDVGPLLVNIIRTPCSACVRYLFGKWKNSNLEPTGHWNHSFSAARHIMSRIPSASSAVFLFALGSHILMNQSGPWLCFI